MRSVENAYLRVVRVRGKRIEGSTVEKQLKKVKRSMVYDCNKSIGFRALEEDD